MGAALVIDTHELQEEESKEAASTDFADVRDTVGWAGSDDADDTTSLLQTSVWPLMREVAKEPAPEHHGGPRAPTPAPRGASPRAMPQMDEQAKTPSAKPHGGPRKPTPKPQPTPRPTPAPKKAPWALWPTPSPMGPSSTSYGGPCSPTPPTTEGMALPTCIASIDAALLIDTDKQQEEGGRGSFGRRGC